MHPNTRDRATRFGVLVLLALAAGVSTLSGQEPVPPPRPADTMPMRSGSGAIIIPIGISQTLGMSTKKPIVTVRLNQEGVVRVQPNPVDPTTVILSGLTSGTVRLFLTDVNMKEEAYDIIVQLDVTYLKRIIADAVPTSNVDIKPVLNRTIILTGWVARAEDVDIILRVAQTVVGAGAQIVNATQVGGVMQVQLDVTVARVNRTELRRRGFNFDIDRPQFNLRSVVGGLGIPTLGGAGGPGGGGGGGNAANVFLGVVPWNTRFLLQALRDEQLAKLLAEPKLVTLSGRPAHFLSGGQQAVTGPSSGLTGAGVIFKDVGTEVDFLPIVLGNGRIYLEVSPVVRSVNNALGKTDPTSGFTPGFSEQSVKTAVELEPGQTMAIGGLIQTLTNASASHIPVLGDLPFIGALFSRVEYQEDEEETIILVTAHLVDPMDCRQAPKRLPGRETRTPDDYELFLESLLEAPRGQRQVFENGRYKAAYKNDPSLRQFPCAEELPREPRNGRAGGRRGGAVDGNCATCYPPRSVPVGADPGAANGGYGERSIPPTSVETLPTGPGRDAPTSRSATGPMIPAPQLDDEPPK